MTRMLRLAPRAIFAVAVLAAVAAAAGEFTQAEFKELHKQLQPDPSEPWRTIPWKVSLLDAQQAAVKENKPIFIWAMDGHPLGCT